MGQCFTRSEVDSEIVSMPDLVPKQPGEWSQRPEEHKVHCLIFKAIHQDLIIEVACMS